MKPFPGWVILEPIEKNKAGLLELPDSAKQETQTGKVIAFGPGYKKDGELVEMNLMLGNTVGYQKYHAYDIEDESGRKLKAVHYEHLMVTLS